MGAPQDRKDVPSRPATTGGSAGPGASRGGARAEAPREDRTPEEAARPSHAAPGSAWEPSARRSAPSKAVSLEAASSEASSPAPGPAHPTIHATCVAIGDVGVLIRGPSGAGKSRLALRLILDAPRALALAELVADDRVVLEPRDGRLMARAPERLFGLLEVRGLGIRRLPARAEVAVGLVVDLLAPDAARLPQEEAGSTIVQGASLPRLAVAECADASLLIAAALVSLSEN